MKAMVLEEFGKPLQLREVPEPVPEFGQVKIRVRAAGVCGTDVKLVAGRSPSVKLPRILGHENAGEIVELGPGVKGFNIGDRVTMHFNEVCGRCENCRTGEEGVCSNFGRRLGFTADGGYAEYTISAAENLIPLPDKVSFEAAAVVTDAVASSWHAAKRAKLMPGQRVLITGLGGLGLNAVQIVKAFGCEVIAVDSIQEKMDAALKAGADHVLSYTTDFEIIVKELTNNKGVDAVLEFRGKPETVEPAVRCLKSNGRMIMVAYYDGGKLFQADHRTFVLSQLQITGSRGATKLDIEECIRLVEMGVLDPPIAQKMPLEKANEALADLKTGKVLGRIVLIP